MRTAFGIRVRAWPEESVRARKPGAKLASKIGAGRVQYRRVRLGRWRRKGSKLWPDVLERVTEPLLFDGPDALNGLVMLSAARALDGGKSWSRPVLHGARPG